MSHLPRRPEAISADWPDLADELARWEEAGRVAVLWWRDDDASSASTPLSTLLRLAAGIPLALAVIPALAEPGLAEAMAGMPQVAVLQHGWRHRDHARQGKKSEYPADRPAPEVAAELAAGRARLGALFGSRALPVLVPPWNRFSPDFLPLLPSLGITAISATPSPAAAAMPPGLAALNVHVDPVAWRGDRGFVGVPAALGALIGELQVRRLGAEPLDRPIGLLTHHLVTDARTEAFVEHLIAVTAAHRAVRWAAVTELLR